MRYIRQNMCCNLKTSRQAGLVVIGLKLLIRSMYNYVWKEKEKTLVKFKISYILSVLRSPNKGLNVPVGQIFRQQTLKQLVSPVVKCEHNVEFYQICNIWTACLYVQVLTRESFPCHHQELAFALGTLTFSNGREFRIRFILVVSVATVCRRSFHMHLYSFQHAVPWNKIFENSISFLHDGLP